MAFLKVFQYCIGSFVNYHSASSQTVPLTMTRVQCRGCHCLNLEPGAFANQFGTYGLTADPLWQEEPPLY